MRKIIYMMLACLLIVPISANAKTIHYNYRQPRKIIYNRNYKLNNSRRINNQRYTNVRLVRKINQRRRNLYINQHNLHWLNHKMIIHHNNPRILYHIKCNRRKINKSIKKERVYLNKNNISNDFPITNNNSDGNNHISFKDNIKNVKHHHKRDKRYHLSHKLKKEKEIKQIYQELNKLHNSNLY